MLKDLSKYKYEKVGHTLCYYVSTHESYLRFNFDKFFVVFGSESGFSVGSDISNIPFSQLKHEKTFNSIKELFEDIESKTDRLLYLVLHHEDKAHLIITANQTYLRSDIKHHFAVICEYDKNNKTFAKPFNYFGFDGLDIARIEKNLKQKFQYCKVYNKYSDAIEDPLLMSYADVLEEI